MSELLERLTAALADRYGIESEIGRGGMATVYLAQDLKHRRKVAIKVLHPELTATLGSERFLQEIEIVAGLQHPHILPLYDSGEADGLLYYVMPYVDGESLRDRLERERQLPLGEAVRIAKEIADALSCAHRHGIIHRDIKPANILLSEGHAHVADFGIARAVSSAGGQSLTATGLTVGSPAYMSPEQAAGEEADERSDLYALGCVLYEMLAGEPPLVGSTAQSTAARRLTDRPTPLPALRESVSAELDAVVAQSLSRTPADRFGSAEEFASVLDAAGDKSDIKPPDSKRSYLAPTIAGLVFLLVAWQILPRLTEPDSPAVPPVPAVLGKSIAVLPFENISGRDEDSQFVDGVHADMVNRLAKINGIAPISRASVLSYREEPRSPVEVAEELGAEMVLEGSIQRTGNRIRVNVQLTDGSGTVVWAPDPYDRELTAENLFDIQSEIAREVTRSLGAELSPAELRRVDARPTDNLEAYQYWHRAYYQINERFNEEEALRLLDRAIEIDPAFGAAHSLRAMALTSLFWMTGRYDTGLCDAAAESLEVARSLDPDLFELRVDTGVYHYRCHRDYKAAIASIDTALQISPNSVEALEFYGVVLRRAGRLPESVDAHLRAVELSPRYADLHWHLESSYALLRNPTAARRHAERAISLSPSEEAMYTNAAWVYYRLSGDPEAAREVIESGRDAGVLHLRMDAWEVWLALLAGYADVAIEKAAVIPADAVISDFLWNPPLRTRFQFLAEAYGQLGERDRQLAYLDSASVLLNGAVQETDEAYLRSALGVAYAKLGRYEDAVSEGKAAAMLLPPSSDAWGATYILENLARIHVLTGDDEAAIDLLERLMQMPGDLTPAYMRQDPTWDPLQQNARFEALVSEEA
jgi:serine/threonine protein kinase/tetratricopeptide (TPR) repeat protein